MTTPEERLAEQVDRASSPVYLARKAEIVDYYKDTYGERGWRAAIKQGFTGIAKNRRGENLSSLSLNRRFESGRELKPTRTAKDRAEYQALGKKLPPIGKQAPPGGFVVRFSGEIRISKKCYERSFTRRITGPAAQEFAQAPSFDMIFRAYFEEDLAEDFCGEPHVEVYPG